MIPRVHARIGDQKKSSLFRSTTGKTKKLTDKPMASRKRF